MTVLHLALAQMTVRAGDVAANLVAAGRLLAEAVAATAGAGVDLVILPELWATGYDWPVIHTHAAPLGEGLWLDMAGLARAHGVHLLGSLPLAAGGRVYNAAVLFDPAGAPVAQYRKTHLFGPMDEPAHFAAGDALPVFDLPWGRTALALCYDLRFPEQFRAYAAAGATVVLLCAQWPVRRIAHWDVLLQARGIENQCVVAACNALGEAMGNPMVGHSAVYGPWGETLAHAGETESVAVARVDLASVMQARAAFPFLADAGW
ncbi:MAG: carbon-nitrogen family hydrolase [Chloroflexi bacterium]|nr:carbon-nitrogen family hydrolase [Chloroflexota bacterium]